MNDSGDAYPGTPSLHRHITAFLTTNPGADYIQVRKGTGRYGPAVVAQLTRMLAAGEITQSGSRFWLVTHDSD